MNRLEKEAVKEMFSEMRTATIRTFDSGATRSSNHDKPEYAGYFHPSVMVEYGKYMFKNQIQPDGKRRDCRNYRKGIPLESYMQSMTRHFISVWGKYEHSLDHDELHVLAADETLMEDLMALMFNVMGMSMEILKTREEDNGTPRN